MRAYFEAKGKYCLRTVVGNNHSYLRSELCGLRLQLLSMSHVVFFLLAALPSVGIHTNSRGETVLRLRGSDERQTSIFLDGTPLTVPWDGRVDLSSLQVGLDILCSRLCNGMQFVLLHNLPIVARNRAQ
jgi:hypothetical protein